MRVRCIKRHRVDSDEAGNVRSALVGFFGEANVAKDTQPTDHGHYVVSWDNGVDQDMPWGFYTADELAEVAEEVIE